jgi:hypothetical protein
MSDDSAVEPVAERGKRGKRGHYRVSARLQRVLLLLATGKAKTQIEACAAEGITTRAL